MTNYYVYYRIDSKRFDEIRFSVERIFKAIKNETGIQGQWLRRRDDAATCMEVYEGVADEAAFEALLEREGAKLGLERKIERFVPACASD